ncbi:MAG: PAS domain-containing protein [Magnetococcales bacterium]|nr:PAS domain-containing protein [Magnetococcales bacterium]
MTLLSDDRKRVGLLVLIMGTMALIVVGVSFWILYETHLGEVAGHLVETAQSRARFIEAVARFDAQHHLDYPGGPMAATLFQVRDAHGHFRGFGASGEFTMARREGDRIVYLLRHRHDHVDQPAPIAFRSSPGEQPLGEPMRLALSNRSGTMVGRDYRGVLVLAAHEPVAVGGMGVVAKIDMAEIRRPFIRSGLWLLGIAALVIGAGATLFFRISGPLIQRLVETEDLRDSRASLARAQEIAHLGNWDWIIPADTLWWSDEVYRIFGLSGGGYSPSYAGFLAAVHEDDRQKVIDAVQTSLADPTIPYRIEHRVVRPDGGERVVEEQGEVIRDSSGQSLRMIGTVHDITERKRGEEALRRLNETLEAQVTERTQDLERSNRELEQFAYVASHDLQEPLRLISGYVQLLARRYQGQLDDKADRFIAYTVDGASHMQALIDSLLAYSRVKSRGGSLKPVDCEVALDRTLELSRDLISRGMALVTRDPLPRVMGDAIQLIQLFQNLIGNAIKFHGPEQPRVHVSARREGADWLLSVTDNGIGIDPRYHDKIFLIFQRLHGRQEYSGTGIGLALCKRIVERHRGRIWVVSQPGVGARFCFTLPAAIDGAIPPADDDIDSSGPGPDVRPFDSEEPA